MTGARDSLVVGGYQLGERIGSGPLAQVYRARGPAGEVAIKLLAADAALEDPAAAARFGHEVAALAAVYHPNVVSLIDHGVDPELGPYLVMPMISGRTLRELIAAGTVEPEIAALAVRELAAGAGALHAAGLVHRDLKPENVIVDGGGRPVIIDLGLAWAAGQTRHTEEGAVAGSVPYMAPEQIESRPPSPQTDLWALAVIAHEWITGSRPFHRGRPSEEVAAILGGRFEPLAVRDRRVSPELGALIDSCLRRDEGPRPATGRELAAALGGLAGGDASAALRDPAAASRAIAEREARHYLDEARRLLDRGKAFAAASAVELAAAHRPADPEVLALAGEVGRSPARRRRPRLWWAAGAAIAAAAIAAALVVSQSDSAEPEAEPEVAPAPSPLAPRDLPERGEVDEIGLRRLERPRHVSMFETGDFEGGPIAYTMRHRPEEVAASGDPEAEARYARALLSTTRRQEGFAFLAASLERHPRSAALWYLRGAAAVRTGDHAAAETALSRAIELDPDHAAALRDRGQLRRLRGQLRAAFGDLDRALELAPDDPEVLGAMARLYLAAGRAAGGVPLARRATELAPDQAQPWVDLAAVSPDAEAIEHLEVALRNDPRSAPARRAMCLVGARLGDPRAYRECLRAGIDDRQDADVILAKGAIFERRGDLARARAELFSGTVTMPDEVRLWVKLAEYEAALGYDYALPKSRGRACELGHQPSCPELAEAPDRSVTP